MNDNDVRIASLVENIHRKNLSDEEKLESLTNIYKSAGYKDIGQVKSYLNKLRGKSYLSKIKIPDQDAEKRKRRPEEVHVPKDFEELARRIAYAPSTQYGILHYGVGERPHIDKNHLESLDRQKKEIITSEPKLQSHPELQQDLAYYGSRDKTRGSNQESQTPA